MQGIKLFLNLTNYYQQDIIAGEFIHGGYTNLNYLIKTFDQKSYIVRAPLKLRDFTNEFKAYQNYGQTKFLSFSQKTGIYVKELIHGYHPDLSDADILKLVLKSLKKVHQTNLKYTIETQDWYEYIEHNDLELSILSLYYRLVTKYDKEAKIFTHHDLNAKNMLVTPRRKVIFIDGEGARLDNPYFDYATLALDDNIDEKTLIAIAKLDKEKLHHYKLMILIFSHMGCNYMNTDLAKQLKVEIFSKIKKMVKKIM